MWSKIDCFKLYVRNITMPPKINHYKQKYVLTNKNQSKKQRKTSKHQTTEKNKKTTTPQHLFLVCNLLFVAPPPPPQKKHTTTQPISPPNHPPELKNITTFPNNTFPPTLTPTPTFQPSHLPTTIQFTFQRDSIQISSKISRWPSWPLIQSSPRVLRMWPFRSRTPLVPWHLGDDGFWERKGGMDELKSPRNLCFLMFLEKFKTRVGVGGVTF